MVIAVETSPNESVAVVFDDCARLGIHETLLVRDYKTGEDLFFVRHVTSDRGLPLCERFRPVSDDERVWKLADAAATLGQESCFVGRIYNQHFFQVAARFDLLSRGLN